MAHDLEIYWDFSSPFAYLGSTQAAALAQRTGASLHWRPMLLGAVFKAIGTPDVPILSWSSAKRSYFNEDMQRWARYWNVPLKMPSRFPMSSVKALRAYLALPEERREAFREATFRAAWAEDRDISDDAVLASILGVVGVEAPEILAQCSTPAIKQALFAATDRAIAAGVFGAPTWIVDGQDLYWGQDRLELVELALRA
jgi:2-hydroxychromene-2-carboxylate isomerase